MIPITPPVCWRSLYTRGTKHFGLFVQRPLLRALTAASVAVGVNALSVAAQARWRFWNGVCGEHALVGHAAAVVPGWIWFLAEERGLDGGRDIVPEAWRNLVGSALTLAGAGLVVAGFRKLGPGALLNADLFSDSPHEWQASGLYGAISDPIYLGYGLSLGGRAVRRRSPESLVVAAWLLALLKGVEAPVERWAHMRAREVRIGAKADESDFLARRQIRKRPGPGASRRPLRRRGLRGYPCRSG